MKGLRYLSLLIAFKVISCHSRHDHEEPSSTKSGDEQLYALRHMAKEHHIDSFDVRSFFQLHDLNRDDFWDKEEIEAIYGVHHLYSQKKSKDDEAHQRKADLVVNTILENMDKDKDGRISPEELEAVGLAGLPNFDAIGAEGHHYDVESEFFLHHEEEFHSTPETQTDESYVHPEDLEHFAHHEQIEHEEAEKEAQFQGITVEEALEQHEPPAAEPGVVEDNVDGAQQPIAAEPASAPKPKVTRLPPPEKQDPHVRFNDAQQQREDLPEWGAGDSGYKRPKSPVDKMRKNLPYKYKFRRNWGDF